MMAFFLLLWLTSATTEDQKRAISEYFTPGATSLSMGGAGGMLGGSGDSVSDADTPKSAVHVVVAIAPAPAREDTPEDPTEE